MPTPLEFIDGPMPEDRMPEDRPEPADYDGRYTEPVNPDGTLAGVPLSVYEEARRGR